MFDVGFSEVFLCFLVALIVLGPQRLPAVARAIGRWTGQAKAYMRNLSAELERETQLADMKKQLEDVQRSMREHTDAIQKEARESANFVGTELKEISHDTTKDLPKS
ncbi:Sec-independent protein translocase protein TatB [Stenotrophobium rhamnosiphilum]|uniref:Twin-arginine translocase subunit TatB n=1 Tax=Stenotrophobium rhamnosiphilum TaxID=2029166 RepID=A0A2T5MFU5_9GAMM|nr:Sec-independent protein translocase protein TatB [Stenotrophobium rhamnosiphilum]PTU31419.1 twin-arginine translocase subunit TatB [Stenotrophobium rhamnosiphilum]